TSGAGTPTGTVTFTEGGTTLASGVPVDGTGHASFMTSSLAVGSHTITASFTGTAGWLASSGSDSVMPQVVNPGAPDHLVFSQQPTNTVAGQAITPAVVVRIVDQFNNLTSSTANVSLTIGTNPGSGTLNGTKTQAATGGVATFSNLSIVKAGVG